MIKIAIIGVGNCAGALIEGIEYYKKGVKEGLLFTSLGGFKVTDLEVVCAFDISKNKVNSTVSKAIYQKPNNFNKILQKRALNNAPVYRGPTLDGNPEHLKEIFDEALYEKSVDVVSKLKDHQVDVVVNLLPTGSDEATLFYGLSALKASCAFINCTPSIFAQNNQIAEQFKKKNIPLIGDDIKSQVGSTIIHRSILNMLENRGACLKKSSQINIGGNSDFANFVYRAHSKLVSKYKSLKQFIPEGVPNHIGHHYDKTKEGYKKTLFDIESTVFGGSKVKISVQLESDDKPNSAGSIIDLVRIAKYEKDKKNGGIIYEACAYYNKSAPKQLIDNEAYEKVKKKWADI